ncbi:MAG TPA: sigma-70 family RNA polymerase sigma factor [Actinomycetota bacterium]|nr:sigma-70 family RNA polymerase sigma factor [Actinomycetota bacterium]
MRDRMVGSPGPSDEALLVSMGLGDRAAARAFVERFQARVYGLALSIVADPVLAEDLAQEALTRAWRNAAAYDARRGGVATWLLTITRNLSIDALRLHRARPTDPGILAGLELASDEPEPGDAAVRSDTARQVRGAVRQLPPDQRRALVLSAFYGQTAQEIATQEGIPLGTAKTRIRAGMRKLRVLLAEGSVTP